MNTGINSTFALGVLRKDVFERRHKLTGSEAASPSIRLDATKFVSSVCTVIEDICRIFGAKTLPRNAKSPLPVNVPGVAQKGLCFKGSLIYSESFVKRTPSGPSQVSA